jgi:hypothetical protein
MSRIEFAPSRAGYIADQSKYEALPPMMRAGLALDGLDRVLTEAGPPEVPVRPGQDKARADAERRYWESRDVPTFKAANRIYDPSIDTKLGELESFVNARAERYLKAMQTAADPKMEGYYRDLYVAMLTDRGDLANWRSLTDHAAKADLYNRVAKEVEIEIKHNVAVMRGDGEQWTLSDLGQLDAGLTAAGAKATLEGEMHLMIQQKEVVGARGRLAAASYDQGVMSFSSLSRDRVQGDLLHQIGLGKVPWGPYQDRLMATSGWLHVGDQDVRSLAKFNHGDLAVASELKNLGVSLPDGTAAGQYYRISKKDGQAFIVPVMVPLTDPQRLVSLRAQEGPADDFAATYALYRLAPDVLRMDYPAKFQLMWDLEQAGRI